MGEGPFSKAALFKKKVIGDCYIQRRYELDEKRRENERKLIAQEQVEGKQLDDDCEKKSLACGKNMECKDKVSYECCKKRVAMDNKYFSLWADLSDKYTQNNYTEDVGYYNSLVYLEAVSSVSDKALTLTTATYTVVFVNNFPGYVLSVRCDPARKPDCEKLNPANKQNANSFDFKDAQCPVNLKIPMGAMKVSLSCKKFGIEVGQGVKFGYEKDFITRESTLSMGVGVDADIPGILDAKAKEKVYVKFDANNQPIDVGLSAEASVGIKGTPPIASAGYTMGVNSGFNFSGISPF